MKTEYLVLIFIIVAVLLLSFAKAAKKNESNNFESSINPIPTNVQQEMRQSTWREGCPIGLDDLAYVKLSYWGFDDKPHTGVLVVSKAVASDVVEIFKTLYLNKFPIQRMEPMEVFKGDDIASMEANNTSAFNCRAKTNKPGEFSVHSFGRAIDINPLINPYVRDGKIYPLTGKEYLDRNTPHPGKIVKDDSVYKEFKKYGWQWGGDWIDLKDYQHFEKE